MTEPSAAVVADSISPEGHRLRSVQVTAHRFILAEINTHRMLSRSYRSSRAVPVKKLLEEVRTNPAMPVHWGANRPGMQASEELTGDALQRAKENWTFAARDAALRAEGMAIDGLHKQIANRVLEPFLWVNGVITATEWENFFGLRLHAAAQPEFRALANAVWAAMKESKPEALEPGDWHLPYVNAGKAFRKKSLSGPDHLRKLLVTSTARCARSSYKSFDADALSTFEEDLALFEKLNIPGTANHDPSSPIHASPAEHQATPDVPAMTIPYWEHAEQHGNFVGFRQHRKILPGETVAPMPEGY